MWTSLPSPGRRPCARTARRPTSPTSSPRTGAPGATTGDPDPTTGATPSSEVRRVRTASGFELALSEAGPRDHAELYDAFAAVVAAGEGYPQSRGPLSYEDFADYWLEHKSRVVIARSAQRLVGSYYLKPNFPGRAAHIANAGYFVVADLRGRGIGQVLVEHSLAEARSLGFDALMFNLVFASNPARRLYERLGFEVIGRIPEAVDGEDALIYWRRLG
jgi:ribosomal protein S18 acetylase RimI-like enzyme